MIWNTATDAARLAHLTECRQEGLGWVAITRELHVGMLKIMPYREQLDPAVSRLAGRWRSQAGLQCPRCGMLVETAGLCGLCRAQDEGRVFLYRELIDEGLD